MFANYDETKYINEIMLLWEGEAGKYLSLYFLYIKISYYNNMNLKMHIHLNTFQKTNYYSKTVLCDLRTEKSTRRHSHRVVIPYRQKKYNYRSFDSYSSSDSASSRYQFNEVLTNSKSKFYLKIY